MKNPDYMKEKLFFYIPLVTFLTFILIMITSLILKEKLYFHSNLYLKYLIIALLLAISLAIIKFIHTQAGLHFFLSVVYFAVLIFDVYKIPSIGIILIIFIFLIIISLLLLKKIIDLYFVALFYLSITYRIFIDPQELSLKICELILVTLLVFTMVLIKYWVVRLVHYKESSLQRMQDTTLSILGKVSELRDEETTNHLKRVEILIDFLINHLARERKYASYITQCYKKDIKSAAYLHDIGKIGISDKLLNKKGPLSREETIEMQKHTLIGYNLIKEAQREMNSESIFDMALEIAKHHHERWDGSGYPDGLKGDSIPLSARIMAVVDVYDALISKRSYKPAFNHEHSLSLIKEESGTHFDPDIIRIFLEHSHEVLSLLEEFQD